jgi:DASH complex subunit DAM1
MTSDDVSFGPPTPKAAPALKPALKKPAAAGARPAAAAPAGAKKAAPKGKISLALRKKRTEAAAQIIDTLPLEYRGADPVRARVRRPGSATADAVRRNHGRSRRMCSWR